MPTPLIIVHEVPQSVGDARKGRTVVVQSLLLYKKTVGYIKENKLYHRIRLLCTI